MLPAPGGELAQIERVGVTCEPAIAGQEPEQRGLLDLAQYRLVPLDRGRVCGHGEPPSSRPGLRPPTRSASRPVKTTTVDRSQPPLPGSHPRYDTPRCRSGAMIPRGWTSFGARLRCRRSSLRPPSARSESADRGRASSDILRWRWKRGRTALRGCLTALDCVISDVEVGHRLANDQARPTGHHVTGERVPLGRDGIRQCANEAGRLFTVCVQ